MTAPAEADARLLPERRSSGIDRRDGAYEPAP